ncbi:MAG: precorrin-3B C(17)-methyltransferase [Victivallales bacterium]|jgi:precorrin-3B C17-methyltransferase|nr:precorrin-3B C(17)-methyltransferase [Victivallales bacterium]
MGEIYAIGIGPGNSELLTLQALNTLSKCTVVIGYKLYLELLGDLLNGKKIIAGTMGQEIERCREALECSLAGEVVGVVSSGDSGVYGMAGLLFELGGKERYKSIEIVVIPGITAALSAAALVGAPFMNDFAVLSLSDLMTDKELIRKRLHAVASCDLPLALYNPRSTKRHELLEEAVAVFKAASGNLPVALVHNAFREQQKIEFVTLDDFPFVRVNMNSIVIFGNTQTVVSGNRFYCRRGYREKYENYH